MSRSVPKVCRLGPDGIHQQDERSRRADFTPWCAQQRTAEVHGGSRFLVREATDCVRSDVKRCGFLMARHEAARVVAIRPGDADGSGATLTALSVYQEPVLFDSLTRPAGELGVNVGTDAWRCPSYGGRTLQEEASKAPSEAVP